MSAPTAEAWTCGRTHTPLASSVTYDPPGHEAHRGACSCGWAGPWRSTRELADMDAMDHAQRGRD